MMLEFRNVFISVILYHCFRQHVIMDILSSESADLSSSQLSQDSYLVEVEEGHLYQEILRLDMTYPNNEIATICSFELLTQQVPFIIEGHGEYYDHAPNGYSLHVVGAPQSGDCKLYPSIPASPEARQPSFFRSLPCVPATWIAERLLCGRH